MWKEESGIAKLNLRDPDFLRTFKRYERLAWNRDSIKPGGNPMFDQFNCEKCGRPTDIRDANMVNIGGVEHTVCDICKARIQAKGFKEWLEITESLTAMKKSDFKEKIPKGTRDVRNDLSKDYPGHLERLGDVGPFKILGSRGKPCAPVAR